MRYNDTAKCDAEGNLCPSPATEGQLGYGRSSEMLLDPIFRKRIEVEYG